MSESLFVSLSGAAFSSNHYLTIRFNSLSLCRLLRVTLSPSLLSNVSDSHPFSLRLQHPSSSPPLSSCLYLSPHLPPLSAYISLPSPILLVTILSLSPIFPSSILPLCFPLPLFTSPLTLSPSFIRFSSLTLCLSLSLYLEHNKPPSIAVINLGPFERGGSRTDEERREETIGGEEIGKERIP